MRKETEKFRDERLTITQVGMVTCIGVDTRSYPVFNGNCFDVLCDDGNNYKVSNFNYENYSMATSRFELSDVKAMKIGERNIIIADERIPTEWYDQRWCSICTPLSLLPAQQQLEDTLSELKGDTTYTEYDGATILSQKIEAKERKLDSGWTVEFEENETVINPNIEIVISKDRQEDLMDSFVYAPYIPVMKGSDIEKLDNISDELKDDAIVVYHEKRLPENDNN